MAYFTASCDPIEKNTRFAESLNLDYPILSDPDGSVATKYGIYNAKRKAPARVTFFVLPDGTIGHIETKVKVASHGADIAAKLKDLGVGEKP